MVQRGLAYAIVVEGSKTLWDKKKIENKNFQSYKFVLGQHCEQVHNKLAR